MSAGKTAPRSAPRSAPGSALCPICEQKPVDPAYRPFCSKRCADIDLGRWLKGGYAIPGAPADETPSGAQDGESGGDGED